jgi:hypothetical protein
VLEGVRVNNWFLVPMLEGRIEYLIIYCAESTADSTYDHRTLKTRLPVRSALFKQRTGGLVVRWVTTSEYPLLYVYIFFCSLSCDTPRPSGIQAEWVRHNGSIGLIRWRHSLDYLLSTYHKTSAHKKSTAPFHDRPDAEHSARLAIARGPSSLISEC